ncbi:MULTISPECIES: hypothetical protein [unclassified Streptomyces]|uniref:hypothetical protein n=1 Tax=unclassified Streptomyces TaxID=2593676 RepID=UPI00344CB9F1
MQFIDGDDGISLAVNTLNDRAGPQINHSAYAGSRLFPREGSGFLRSAIGGATITGNVVQVVSHRTAVDAGDQTVCADHPAVIQLIENLLTWTWRRRIVTAWLVVGLAVVS